jgi:hypothetical protein
MNSMIYNKLYGRGGEKDTKIGILNVIYCIWPIGLRLKGD